MGLMRDVVYNGRGGRIVQKIIHNQCRAMQRNCFLSCKRFGTDKMPQNCGYAFVMNRPLLLKAIRRRVPNGDNTTK
jgi:hypothetical protein